MKLRDALAEVVDSAAMGYAASDEAVRAARSVATALEGDGESTAGDFVAEVAEALRGVAPSVSGLDGYHIERLFDMARAFGWEGER